MGTCRDGGLGYGLHWFGLVACTLEYSTIASETHCDASWEYTFECFCFLCINFSRTSFTGDTIITAVNRTFFAHLILTCKHLESFGFGLPLASYTIAIGCLLTLPTSDICPPAIRADTVLLTVEILGCGIEITIATFVYIADRTAVLWALATEAAGTEVVLFAEVKDITIGFTDSTFFLWAQAYWWRRAFWTGFF